MNKNLTHINTKNTRCVLFEKAERYFYKVKNNGPFDDYTCDEKCPITNFWIGSVSCAECEFNQAFHDFDNFVVCEKLKNKNIL
jgi:hypothetical protein